MTDLDFACELLMRFAQHDFGCSFEMNGKCQCGLHSGLKRLDIEEYPAPLYKAQSGVRTGTNAKTSYFDWGEAVP